MIEESSGEWVSCVVDDDYEIWTEYPYPLRKKGNDWIVKDCVNTIGYVVCHLNNKTLLKHRIIAQQFLPNDDPENKIQVDHINHDRTDNRIENLRWCTRSENNKNITGKKGHRYTFLDELPETAEPFEFYNNHMFDDLWIDYDSQKLYWFNGIKYRELIEHRGKNVQYFNAYDTEGKHVALCHGRLFD